MGTGDICGGRVKLDWDWQRPASTDRQIGEVKCIFWLPRRHRSSPLITLARWCVESSEETASIRRGFVISIAVKAYLADGATQCECS